MLILKNKMRPELKELPIRMAELPIDDRGYPIPWFVAYVGGQPEFRAMDISKWRRATRENLCWVCGKRLGAYVTFVIGPMCLINRTSAEPPAHRECARWSAINCPFLSRPLAKRRELEDAQTIGGCSIKRNPGVTLLLITRTYEVWHPASGESLIEIGEPLEWEWWSEGRPATRAEVQESVRTGLPHLEALARQQEGAMEDLQKRVKEFDRFLPAR